MEVNVDNWHELKYHELCTLLPPMNDEEYAELVESMKEHGFFPTDPIVLVDRGPDLAPVVLDGRNRHLAAMDSGVTPKFEFLPDNTDPASWVMGRNLARRHMTSGQRAAVASSLANLPMGVNAGEEGVTIPQAAKMCGVGEASIAHYRVVESRDKEAAAAVRAGTQSLRAAYQAAKVSQGPGEGGGQRPSEATPPPASEAVTEPMESAPTPEELDAPDPAPVAPAPEPAGSEDMQFDGKKEHPTDAYYDVGSGMIVMEVMGNRLFIRPDTAEVLGEKLLDACEVASGEITAG